MELTEFEFDNLLNSAMKIDENIPYGINDKLKKKINSKYRYKKMIKSIPVSAAACLVAGVVLTSVMYNNQNIYDIPKGISNVPDDNGIVISSVIEEDIKVPLENEKIVPKVSQNTNVDLSDDTAKTKSNETINFVLKSAEQEGVTPGKTSVAESELAVFDGDEMQVTDPVSESYAQELPEDSLEYSTRAMPEVKNISLAEYLANDQALITLVSQKIKEQMLYDSEFGYFEDFSMISGNERYYLTEQNELVIIFDAGTIAPTDHGEMYFNVGVVK